MRSIVVCVFGVLVGCGGKVAASDGDAASADSSVTIVEVGTADGFVGDTGHGDSSHRFDVAPPPDEGRPDISPPPPGCEATVGKPCTGDADCDPLGTGDNVCFVHSYPSPVCVGNSCDPGDGTKIIACDNCDGTDRGICFSESTGGICIPACSFDDTGAHPKGCIGKDACVAFGWSTTGSITGVGYCWAGCFADADCPSGNVCQIEDGTCVKSITTFTKKPGDACTYKTSGVQDCNCYAAAATLRGYCTSFCEAGDTAHACPGGLKCTAALPAKCASGSPLFTKTPAAMFGYCALPCVADADCKDPSGADIASTCLATSDGKFCLPYDPGGGC